MENKKAKPKQKSAANSGFESLLGSLARVPKGELDAERNKYEARKAAKQKKSG